MKEEEKEDEGKEAHTVKGKIQEFFLVEELML